MVEWDIRKLQILRTLRERGTVTATAEALRMTPSAVSQQLTNLAKQVGVPLLEAQGRRVRLTDAARLVLRHAEAVFEQLERADAELAAYMHGEVGEVRVGAFSTAVPALVVPAVRALRASHPGVVVRVREAEAGEAYELLAASQVDLALSLAAQAPVVGDARFTRVPLLADPLDVALPRGHRLAERETEAVRLADLAGEDWIFGGSGPWSDITRGGLRGSAVQSAAGAFRGRVDGDPGDGGGGDGGGVGAADGCGAEGRGRDAGGGGAATRAARGGGGPEGERGRGCGGEGAVGFAGRCC